MVRIPTLERKENLAPEHHAIYDAIAQSRGEVRGPFAVLLHSPEIAERTAYLGAYIRFESQLDPGDLELATLTVARELDCKHEWAAHLAHARKIGVPEETITAIHNRKAPSGLSVEEAQIVSYVHELLRSHRVSTATFQSMLDRFGVKGLVELTATVGYYAMLACTLNAFEMESVTAPDHLKI